MLSDVFPDLRQDVSIRTVERIAVVALIVILFHGGMHIGLRRFRVAATPIVLLGTVGTFATAAVMTVAAKLLLDVDWTTAGIIGAALAPTDPAVTFSVLGRREVVGRTGTILEGESGMNDPVGIALMIGMVELANEPDATFWVVVEEFVVEMTVGLAFGLVGGALLHSRDAQDLAAERRPLPAANARRRGADLRRRVDRRGLGLPGRLRRRAC